MPTLLPLSPVKTCAYLATSQPLINFAGQLIASTHLTNVHPAREASPLQTVSYSRDLVLHIPLVADKYRWLLQLKLCNTEKRTIQ